MKGKLELAGRFYLDTVGFAREDGGCLGDLCGFLLTPRRLEAFSAVSLRLPTLSHPPVVAAAQGHSSTPELCR